LTFLSYSLVAISSATCSLLSVSFINKYCFDNPIATSTNCSLVYSFSVSYVTIATIFVTLLPPVTIYKKAHSMKITILG
jgi:hypothetical protein